MIAIPWSAIVPDSKMTSPARTRLAGAALVFATGPIAARAGSLVQLAIVVAVLVLVLTLEHRSDATTE